MKKVVRTAIAVILVFTLMATPVCAAPATPEEYGAKILEYIGLFFADPRVQTILGLIILEVFLAVAAALKKGQFEWRRLADFYRTMVIPYLLGFLGFFLAGKFVKLALVEPYDVIVGEGAIWLAWITLVFNLVADIYAKAKELGIPLPDLPGFPPE